MNGKTIDDLINFRIRDDDDEREDDDVQVNQGEVDADAVGELREMIMSIKVTLELQDRKINQLEIEMERLKTGPPKEKYM